MSLSCEMRNVFFCVYVCVQSTDLSPVVCVFFNYYLYCCAPSKSLQLD